MASRLPYLGYLVWPPVRSIWIPPPPPPDEALLRRVIDGLNRLQFNN